MDLFRLHSDVDNGSNRKRGMPPRFVEDIMFDPLPSDSSNAERQVIHACWAELKTTGACDAFLPDRITAMRVLTSARFLRGCLDGWCHRHWSRRLSNGDRVDVFYILGSWSMTFTPAAETPQYFEAEWELEKRARQHTVACRILDDHTTMSNLLNVAA